jgi:hypothetical protein
MSIGPNEISLILVGGGFCVAMLLFVFVGVPFITQVAFGLEIVNMIVDAVGEYTGQPGLVKLGCVALMVAIFGCCLAGFVGALGLAGCYVGTPNQLCRLIGR